MVLSCLRHRDCFLAQYDENRQTMFFCGFFTSLAGFLWFITGWCLKAAFFTEAFGSSVTAVACGIMIVGLMVLAIGIGCTLSIMLRSREHNKTQCVSDIKRQRLSDRHHRQKNVFFNNPQPNNSSRNGSFSSEDLNPGSFLHSSSSSSPSSSGSRVTFNSDIAIIA